MHKADLNTQMLGSEYADAWLLNMCKGARLVMQPCQTHCKASGWHAQIAFQVPLCQHRKSASLTGLWSALDRCHLTSRRPLQMS